MRKLMVLILLMFFSSSMWVSSQSDCPDGFEKSYWLSDDGQWIIVKSYGTYDPEAELNEAQKEIEAYRNAYLRAAEKIGFFLDGVKIDSYSTLENELMRSDILKTQMKAFIAGITQIDMSGDIEKKYFPDGSFVAVATLKIPVYGKSSITEILTKYVANKNYKPIVKEKPYRLPKEIKSEIKKESEVGYTGIIINAQGPGLERVQFPSILAPDGTVIFGKIIFTDDNPLEGQISIDDALEKGIVSYGTNIYEAMKNSRIGSNPLIVKGIDIKGVYSGDVVVSSEDAQKIILANKKNKFLEKLRVIIVL